MKRVLPFAVALCCFIAAATAQSRVETTDPRVAALEKANAALAKAQLDTGGTIVISMRRGYIVVSYLQMEANVRGGGAHVVYDPRSNKVVYILGQD